MLHQNNNVLNVNSFLNKISVQDRASGKFICPKCSDFFTNSKTEFHDHFSNNHIDYNQISCVYCEMNFDLSNISGHIESHFEESRMSTNICYLCNRFSKMDCLESILDHLMYQHNNQLICPICKVEYTNHSEFIEHINKNINIVYHCTSESCQMKTNDKEEMNFHQSLSGHLVDLCFEEHIFNCQSKDDRFKYNYFDSLSDYSSKSVDLISDDVNVSILEETEKTNTKFIANSDYTITLSCPKVFPQQVLKQLNPKVLEHIKEKLEPIDKYFVSVSVKGSNKKYHCSECDYFSNHQHSDTRKHIIMCHCGISLAHVRACLRTVEFTNVIGSKSEIVNNSLTKESATINSEKTDPIDKEDDKRSKSQRIVKKNTRNADFVEIVDSDDIADDESIEEAPIVSDTFDYIVRLQLWDKYFEKEFKNIDSESRNSVKSTLATIGQFSIGVTIINDGKLYRCLQCAYVSKHSHADVRKHILLIHLLIPSTFVRKCLRTTRFFHEPSEKTANQSLGELDSFSQKNKENHGQSNGKSFDTNERSLSSVLVENKNFKTQKLESITKRTNSSKESSKNEVLISSMDIVKDQLSLLIENNESKKPELPRKSIDKRTKSYKASRQNEISTNNIDIERNQLPVLVENNNSPQLELPQKSINTRKKSFKALFQNENSIEIDKNNSLIENNNSLKIELPQKSVNKRKRSFKASIENENSSETDKKKLLGESNNSPKIELPKKSIDKRTKSFKASLENENSIEIDDNKLLVKNSSPNIELPKKSIYKRKKSFKASIENENTIEVDKNQSLVENDNNIPNLETSEKSIDKRKKSFKASIHNKNSIETEKNKSFIENNNIPNIEISQKPTDKRKKSFKASFQNENSSETDKKKLLIENNNDSPKIELPQKPIDKRTKSFKASLVHENPTNKIEVEKLSKKSIGTQAKSFRSNRQNEISTNSIAIDNNDSFIDDLPLKLQLPRKSIDKRTKLFKASLRQENGKIKDEKLESTHKPIDKQRKSGPEFSVDKISPKTGVIRMDYCDKAFDKYFRQKNTDFPTDLKAKMERYKTFSMAVSMTKGEKVFECVECSYQSSYYIADLKKHIMARHCGVNQLYMKDCLKFCRTNPNLELLPYREIIELINRERKLKREPPLSDSEEDPCPVEKTPVVRHAIGKKSNPKPRLSVAPNYRKRKSSSSRKDPVKQPRLSRDTADNQSNRFVVDRQISLHYSEPILRALCNIENVSHRFQELKNKLQFYCQTTVKIGRNLNSDIFVCSKCDWLTRESLASVSHHILTEHTGIGMGLLPIAHMSTKLSPHGTLMSDSDISQLGWNHKPILLDTTANDSFIDLTDN